MPQLTKLHCETGKNSEELASNVTFKGNKRAPTRRVPDLKATQQQVIDQLHAKAVSDFWNWGHNDIGHGKILLSKNELSCVCEAINRFQTADGAWNLCGDRCTAPLASNHRCNHGLAFASSF